jgi:hypothetical protein
MMVRLQKTMLVLVVASLTLTAPLVPVHAVIVGTDQALAMAERSEVVDRIHAVLTRDDVRVQLEALGVDPQRALERVEAMTASELVQLDGQLQSLPAGGSVLGILGAILVVLIVLDVLGVTNVFRNL